jgi:hypothetical protein
MLVDLDIFLHSLCYLTQFHIQEYPLRYVTHILRMHQWWNPTRVVPSPEFRVLPEPRSTYKLLPYEQHKPVHEEL